MLSSILKKIEILLKINSFSCFDADETPSSSADATKISAAAVPTNGLTRSRRSHFSLADTKMDSIKENAGKKRADAAPVSYDNERLKMMAKFHHSRQFPHDWLKICELYPNIVRNKVRDIDDKNNNDLNSNNVTNNNNHNKFHAKSNHSVNNAMRRSVSVSQ